MQKYTIFLCLLQYHLSGMVNSSNELYSNLIQNLKEKIRNFVKETIPSFNEYIMNSSEIPLEYSNVNIKMLKGNSSQFTTLYNLHFDFIKEFMGFHFQENVYKEFFMGKSRIVVKHYVRWKKNSAFINNIVRVRYV